MTIDRTALRGIAAEVHKRNLSAKFGDPRYSCTVGSDELLALVSGVPQLLNELDAKDRRIAELEAACQSVRSGAAEAVAAHDAQVARIAELEGRLERLQRAHELTSGLLTGAGERIAELELRDGLLTQIKAERDTAHVAMRRLMAEVADRDTKIADALLRLSIATELNVNDRKRIADLEGALRHCDALAFTGRQTAVARGDDDGSKRRAFFRDISDTARAVLPSEET